MGFDVSIPQFTEHSHVFNLLSYKHKQFAAVHAQNPHFLGCPDAHAAAGTDILLRAVVR